MNSQDVFDGVTDIRDDLVDGVKELAAERGERSNTTSQRLLRLRKDLRAFLESEGVEL